MLYLDLWVFTWNLQEGGRQDGVSAGIAAGGAATVDGERYAITDLTDRGFILSTVQVCFQHLRSIYTYCESNYYRSCIIIITANLLFEVVWYCTIGAGRGFIRRRGGRRGGR